MSYLGFGRKVGIHIFFRSIQNNNKRLKNNKKMANEAILLTKEGYNKMKAELKNRRA